MRGSSAVVMLPNVAVPNVVPMPEPPAAKPVEPGAEGMPARKLLVRLKASARNSTVCFSRMRIDLAIARSICQNAGPGMLFLPTPLNVPSAGVAKAAGLIQQLGGGPG